MYFKKILMALICALALALWAGAPAAETKGSGKKADDEEVGGKTSAGKGGAKGSEAKAEETKKADDADDADEDEAEEEEEMEEAEPDDGSTMRPMREKKMKRDGSGQGSGPKMDRMKNDGKMDGKGGRGMEADQGSRPKGPGMREGGKGMGGAKNMDRQGRRPPRDQAQILQRALENTDLQMSREMNKHNERAAKLKRIREVGDEETKAEADKMLQEENDRHQRAMNNLERRKKMLTERQAQYDKQQAEQKAGETGGEEEPAEPAEPEGEE